jgi:hypothetical protein
MGGHKWELVSAATTGTTTVDTLRPAGVPFNRCAHHPREVTAPLMFMGSGAWAGSA